MDCLNFKLSKYLMQVFSLLFFCLHLHQICVISDLPQGFVCENMVLMHSYDHFVHTKQFSIQ